MSEAPVGDSAVPPATLAVSRDQDYRFCFCFFCVFVVFSGPPPETLGTFLASLGAIRRAPVASIRPLTRTLLFNKIVGAAAGRSFTPANTAAQERRLSSYRVNIPLATAVGCLADSRQGVRMQARGRRLPLAGPSVSISTFWTPSTCQGPELTTRGE